MVGVADSKIADLKIMKMWPNSESILPLFSKKGLSFTCPSLFTDPKCHLVVTETMLYFLTGCLATNQLAKE